MNESKIALTLEQEFSLRQLSDKMERMDGNELIQLCKFLARSMMEKDLIYKDLLAKEWGLVPPESLG